MIYFIYFILGMIFPFALLVIAVIIISPFVFIQKIYYKYKSKKYSKKDAE